jgi:hypothetical protein
VTGTYTGILRITMTGGGAVVGAAVAGTVTGRATGAGWGKVTAPALPRTATSANVAVVDRPATAIREIAAGCRRLRFLAGGLRAEVAAAGAEVAADAATGANGAAGGVGAGTGAGAAGYIGAPNGE